MCGVYIYLINHYHVSELGMQSGSHRQYQFTIYARTDSTSPVEIPGGGLHEGLCKCWLTRCQYNMTGKRCHVDCDIVFWCDSTHTHNACIQIQIVKKGRKYHTSLPLPWNIPSATLSHCVLNTFFFCFVFYFNIKNTKCSAYCIDVFSWTSCSRCYGLIPKTGTSICYKR